MFCWCAAACVWCFHHLDHEEQDERQHRLHREISGLTDCQLQLMPIPSDRKSWRIKRPDHLLKRKKFSTFPTSQNSEFKQIRWSESCCLCIKILKTILEINDQTEKRKTDSKNKCFQVYWSGYKKIHRTAVYIFHIIKFNNKLSVQIFKVWQLQDFIIFW